MRIRVIALLAMLSSLTLNESAAQPTVRFDASKTHQRITGFGGFVNSPQFTYNHMSDADIKKVWGSSSTIGCNIMRVYLPIGRNAWSQSLTTIRSAKRMGLIVFASPWGQPAEWKTNGTINAKNSDTGETGKLYRKNWPDYAQYLEDYVQYLRQNGVELDAISIQNEPDWAATYAGCLWSESEMAEFVKTYGPSISCKVIAPESIVCSDGYVNALNKTDVLAGFDIYGGHQYGGIGTAYKQLAKKNKELWMTEYLINWNENQQTSRNYDFSQDFFNFFRAINTCMIGDFNAWIHYAAKRFYAMLGDGQYGTQNGTVTKRGYVMAHFARFVTGMTRIDINYGSTGLEGSAYLSETGDTVVAVMANTGSKEVEMTLDLPFYTQSGMLYSTTKTRSLAKTTLEYDSETCRPVITVPALSVSTVYYLRSRNRQPSNMKGSSTSFDRINDMAVTNQSFGTTYKMSNTTRTFDHNNPLISPRTDTRLGYVALDDRYNKLVIEVKKVTSTMNYSSAKTTLVYVNSDGEVASHDYGDLSLESRQNFTLEFDLSKETLPDGCKGLISMTNNNWSSTLTLTLGDVLLLNGTDKLYSATLSGAYVEDDSYVQEYKEAKGCTSLNMTNVTDLPDYIPWLSGSNRVVTLPEGSLSDASNVISGVLCRKLELTPEGGNFRPEQPFTTEETTLTVSIEGARMLMLPFAAEVPEGVTAYTISPDMELEEVTTITAHTPVLVTGNGMVVFSGEGEVSFAKSPLDDMLRGTYTAIPLYTGDYVLTVQDGVVGFRRIEATESLSPFDVYATLNSTDAFIPLMNTTSIEAVISGNNTTSGATYDLQGRRILSTKLKPGIYIRGGKKILISL